MSDQADRDSETAENRNRSLRPLARLVPYLLNYRRAVGAAVFFLLLATAATLTLPIAVRRMIDKGFFAENAGFIDNYFGMLIVIAVVLAVSSACRDTLAGRHLC